MDLEQDICSREGGKIGPRNNGIEKEQRLREIWAT